MNKYEKAMADAVMMELRATKAERDQLREQLRISRLNEGTCMCGSPQWAHVMGHEEHNFVENREPCQFEKERDQLRAELAAANKRVAELEEASRWRKWPEEKPEKDGIYQISVIANGQFPYGFWTYRADNADVMWGDSVTHWRPITPPA